jgi:hypothetical protein
MGFRFRRSIRLGKGLRLNISKSGTSLSVGRRGATVNLSSKGERVTVGLPGTGLSYSQQITPHHQAPAPSPPAAPPSRHPLLHLVRLAVLGFLIVIMFLVIVAAGMRP